MARGFRVTAGLAAAGCLSGLASGASAQSSADSEIVVTGERANRTAAQTASSVVVVTAEEIDAASGADRIDQILQGVVNVQLGSGSEGPVIRGQDTTGPLRDLPAFLGGNRPRATLQVDGRAVTYSEFVFGATPLWDVEKVEVFRSPQTTTQGRNSIAGAIFVTTADPTFEWQARARAQLGSPRMHQVSSTVSGPLASDQLAIRLSADLRRGLSSSRLSSPAADVDPNKDDYDQLRLKLLAAPKILPGARVLATYALSRSQAPQIEGIVPPYRQRRDPAASYGIFRNRVDSLTLQGELPVAPGLTASLTGSSGTATIRRIAPTGFGQTRIESQDGALEGRLHWTGTSGLVLVAGVHGEKIDLDQQIDLTSARLGRGAFVDRQSSLGLFGEADFEVIPKVHVLTGARYQRDSQRRQGLLTSPERDIVLQYDETFDALLPKFSLAYEPLPQTRVGVLVQRAYNPGGTTINLSTFAPDAFDAETLWAYELFARHTLAGGTIDVALNVFYYDMDNAQRSLAQVLDTPGGIVTFAEIANAPAALSRGAELQAEWRPTARLELQAALGLLRTKLTRTLDPRDPLLGKEFQRSPHRSMSLAATWRPLDPVRLSAQLRHHSAYFSDDANDPARRIAPSTTVDARAEWTGQGLSVFGYARNVLDEFHLTYMFAPAGRLATAGDPREVGFGMEARF